MCHSVLKNKVSKGQRGVEVATKRTSLPLTPYEHDKQDPLGIIMSSSIDLFYKHTRCFYDNWSKQIHIAVLFEYFSDHLLSAWLATAPASCDATLL